MPECIENTKFLALLNWSGLSCVSADWLETETAVRSTRTEMCDQGVWPFIVNPFWHLSHQNLKTPVCLAMWYCRPRLLLNVFGHGSHDINLILRPFNGVDSSFKILSHFVPFCNGISPLLYLTIYLSNISSSFYYRTTTLKAVCLNPCWTLPS